MNILPWQIYTDKDIQMQSAKSSYKKGTGIFNIIWFFHKYAKNLKMSPQIKKILMYILYKALNTIFRTKQSVQAQSG